MYQNQIREKLNHFFDIISFNVFKCGGSDRSTRAQWRSVVAPGKSFFVSIFSQVQSLVTRVS